MPKRLRHEIPYEEFDYQALLSALGDYKRPRDRITKLLQRGTIVRVKKGLYVFGADDSRGPVQKGILANLIYGPSYISLEYALREHGLIPERVEAVTSVALGRARAFTTPLGRFTYRTIPLPAFRTGVERVKIGQGRHYLRALPEKALADKLYADKVPSPTQKAIRTYLIDDLRVDQVALRALDPDLLADYAERYRSRKIRLLAAVVGRMKRTAGGQDRA